MLSKGAGDVHIPCLRTVAQRVMVASTLAEEMWLLARESDLAVVAKAGTYTSHMNEAKSFLYSDWKVTVEEVVKNNPKAPVQLGATITVTRPGGELEINGLHGKAER